ncbi:MAG: hypothetical protein ACW99G_04950 [Candidatus Thorarchaeota archaeon]|jgi:hypothetical protein
MIGEMWQHKEMKWLTLRVQAIPDETRVQCVIEVEDESVSQFNGISMEFTLEQLKGTYKPLLPSLDDFNWEV